MLVLINKQLMPILVRFLIAKKRATDCITDNIVLINGHGSRFKVSWKMTVKTKNMH